MNFPLLTSVLQSDLPCPQRMILTVLLNHADADGKAWPCQATIAKQAGLGERTVREHLAELIASGWLKAKNTGRGHVFIISRPAESASQTGADCQSERQNPPVSTEADRQILPVRAAEITVRAAESASQTGADCRQTTQEPPSTHPRTKPEGAGEPPPVVVKAKTSKPDWREWNRANAEKANAVELPLHAPAEFRIAWQRWREYRTAKAVDARIASEAIEWTAQAAESGIRDCERASAVHGWPAVIARMDQAMQGWRGFNFDRLQPPRPMNGHNGQRQPKNPAYNADTATAGMTKEQILQF